jgi:hypothetical protein
MGKACSTYGRDDTYIQNFGRRWEDNIRMDLTGIEWEDVEWMHLAQDRDQWWAPLSR